MTNTKELYREMIRYYQGDPKRIQHFVKVHSFAMLIGEGEKLDSHTLLILSAAALVHDIGIKPAEKKYGSCGGKLQEQEGPEPAKEILQRLGFSEDVTRRVCYLVSKHHTYTEVDGIDYRILLEADFLVNAYEDGLSEESVKAAMDKFFRTETGIAILKDMYHL